MASDKFPETLNMNDLHKYVIIHIVRRTARTAALSIVRQTTNRRPCDIVAPDADIDILRCWTLFAPANAIEFLHS